ncbi:MAG: hypothetical protein J7K23_01050 [Thermoproteales archaeon]|nr:hypothetical protein [Thermoproteales archaeon]
MNESIKIDISKVLASKFWDKALTTYGYRKGAFRKALEDLLKKYIGVGEVDWRSLRGSIKSDKSSLELQHRTLVRTD